MSAGKQMIYKQLLQEHGRIRVPMIQRDYAQGRPAESTVRDLFLNALADALGKPAGDPALPLNLDFVYGSVEGRADERFLPLDGQQRLTTLFLLHWYLAWRDDQWPTFTTLFYDGSHSRFAYDVRPSSNEFFDQLVCYRPTMPPDQVDKLTDLIADQPWYFRSWRLDPTIQAVLCMLDAIHAKFVSTRGLFARLVEEQQPAITFQLLKLEHFGLSDDLYIKMNARGKPLTAFETFKARYEQELHDQLPGVTFALAGHQFCAADYVARRMDTAWADLFWKRRDRRSQQYDDALMNVFRTLALITRNPEDEKYLEDVALLRSGRTGPSYADFHARRWLDEPFTLTMIRLFDAWSAGSETLARLLPDVPYFDEAAFFGKAASPLAWMSYTEIIQFAAYARYIAAYHDALDPAAFGQWMRVVSNLAANTIHNRPDDFARSMRSIEGLLEHATDILSYFAGAEKPATGFYEQQIAEEKLKAELILADGRWRTLIDSAEGHPYFRGQIWFLLDFCGAVAARDKCELKGWDPVIHADLQDHFARYLALAAKMFTEKGLEGVGQYRWQRALLSIGDYLLPNGRNMSFLVDRPTDEASWKRLLRGVGNRTPEPREYLKQLWDGLTPDTDLAPQLDTIIAERGPLAAWREALVRWPQSIEYCEDRNIRWMNGHTLYLLKRSQLNGAHVELFTFCLHQELLLRQSSFAVLGSSYMPITGADWEPRLVLSGETKGKMLEFLVFNAGEGYQIQIAVSNCSAIANLCVKLRTAGYLEDDGWLFINHPRAGMLEFLQRLDQMLARL